MMSFGRLIRCAVEWQAWIRFGFYGDGGELVLYFSHELKRIKMKIKMKSKNKAKKIRLVVRLK